MLEYKDVFEKLNELKMNDLTMNSFSICVSILREALSICCRDWKKGINSIDKYNAVISKIDEIFFTKIKEKFGFNNKIIFRMLDSVHHTNQIPLDILVIGDNVLIVYQSISSLDLDPSSYLVLSDKYQEVTSNDWFGSWNNCDKKTRNSVLNSMIDLVCECLESIDGSMGIAFSENKIIYTYPNVSAYCDIKISDVCDNLEKNEDSTFNIVCKTQVDKLNCFEITYGKNNCEISEVDYPVWKLSENLKENKDYVLKKN